MKNFLYINMMVLLHLYTTDLLSAMVIQSEFTHPNYVERMLPPLKKLLRRGPVLSIKSKEVKDALPQDIPGSSASIYILPPESQPDRFRSCVNHFLVQIARQSRQTAMIFVGQSAAALCQSRSDWSKEKGLFKYTPQIAPYFMENKYAIALHTSKARVSGEFSFVEFENSKHFKVIVNSHTHVFQHRNATMVLTNGPDSYSYLSDLEYMQRLLDLVKKKLPFSLFAHQYVHRIGRI